MRPSRGSDAGELTMVAVVRTRSIQVGTCRHCGNWRIADERKSEIRCPRMTRLRLPKRAAVLGRSGTWPGPRAAGYRAADSRS